MSNLRMQEAVNKLPMRHHAAPHARADRQIYGIAQAMRRAPSCSPSSATFTSVSNAAEMPSLVGSRPAG